MRAPLIFSLFLLLETEPQPTPSFTEEQLNDSDWITCYVTPQYNSEGHLIGFDERCSDEVT